MRNFISLILVFLLCFCLFFTTFRPKIVDENGKEKPNYLSVIEVVNGFSALKFISEPTLERLELLKSDLNSTLIVVKDWSSGFNPIKLPDDVSATNKLLEFVINAVYNTVHFFSLIDEFFEWIGALIFVFFKHIETWFYIVRDINMFYLQIIDTFFYFFTSKHAFG